MSKIVYHNGMKGENMYTSSIQVQVAIEAWWEYNVNIIMHSFYITPSAVTPLPCYTVTALHRYRVTPLQKWAFHRYKSERYIVTKLSVTPLLFERYIVTLVNLETVLTVF